MSRRAVSGGFDNRPPATRAPTPREYVNRYFPPGSILAEPAGSPLERGEPFQTIRDCLFVVAALLFLTVTGIGLAFAAFVLLFVRV
jgi:hypothetical protein